MGKNAKWYAVLISKFQGFNQKQYDDVSFTDYIDIKDRLEGD